MSYAEEVNDRLTFTRQAALREGEIVVPGSEGLIAHEVLDDVLADEAVIRATVTEIAESEANDMTWDEVIAVFSALRRVLEGER